MITNKDLANLMYPNITKSPCDYEKKYPERKLPEGAVVSRFAPSPTGFVHMGSLLTALVAAKVPKDTRGIFFLRIEDTDGKRKVENGIQGIIDDLVNFDIQIDEGVVSESEEKGKYGPYVQTRRKEIYDTYAKYMIENDLAYPCFCTEKELENIRDRQEKNKERIGYYGSFAKCRYLSIDEAYRRIKNGEKYVIRLKSPGNFNKKIEFNDLVRGKMVFPENDIDVILVKSDGIPVYHFAHVIDDHLMRTTHILRGEEWLSSTPVHLQLFEMLKFKAPRYAHLGLVMKIDEDGTRRKLSKRKDPEAAVSYYHERGIPAEAVKLYLMTLANSNFEEWLNQNIDKGIDDFTFNFKKMSMSGSLFDVEKLLNISRNYISRLSKEEVYRGLCAWALEFDNYFYNLIVKYKNYTLDILNIEREQKKPRKDYANYSEIKEQIFYMYDELYNPSDYEWGNISEKQEIIHILDVYMDNYFDVSDKDNWFNKIKELTDDLGYASNMKEYKINPHEYKGSVADISTVLRVAITSKCMTPDLYVIMKLLGKERIQTRLKLLKEKLSL